MEIPQFTYFLKLVEINQQVISVLYLKKFNEILESNNFFIKMFNIQKLEKQDYTKTLSPNQKTALLSIQKPKIFLAVSQDKIKILILSNPKEDEYKNREKSVLIFEDYVRIIDLY